jgi:3-oxoacyl-[acyl-carrier-protein] synthase II
VDYINAHGTATPHNDLAEARGIATLFGARAADLPVSSTKSQIGHLLGASAAVELVACVLALQHGFLPPTSGWEERDPEIPVEDFVPGRARNQQSEVDLSNSFAFGGNDASLCLERV